MTESETLILILTGRSAITVESLIRACDCFDTLAEALDFLARDEAT